MKRHRVLGDQIYTAEEAAADALGLYMQLGAITEEERTSVATPTP